MFLQATSMVTLVVGYIFTWVAWPIWITRAIYEMVKTDQGFFTIVFSNMGLGLLQFCIGLVLVFIGAGLNLANSK